MRSLNFGTSNEASNIWSARLGFLSSPIGLQTHLSFFFDNLGLQLNSIYALLHKLLSSRFVTILIGALRLGKAVEVVESDRSLGDIVHFGDIIVGVSV